MTAPVLAYLAGVASSGAVLMLYTRFFAVHLGYWRCLPWGW